VIKARKAACARQTGKEGQHEDACQPVRPVKCALNAPPVAKSRFTAKVVLGDTVQSIIAVISVSLIDGKERSRPSVIVDVTYFSLSVKRFRRYRSLSAVAADAFMFWVMR